MALCLGLLVSAPASAEPAPRTSSGAPVTAAASAYWACSVPAGMTFTKAERRLNVCNPTGWAISYYVTTPTDNLWACTLPSGFTHDLAERRLNVCNA
ncbi:hypothetical protein RM528_36895, partial [Streptomyces sp. DSM 41635]|nr:hypothetical protein [Streptomyces sp. DSM 41635]